MVTRAQPRAGGRTTLLRVTRDVPARFLFLGTGTSGGVPLIACDCLTCTSADPRDKRTRTGAAVQWIDPSGKPRTVLIDATPDLRQQALRHDLWRVDAILFTHNHVDHIFGLDEVRRFNAVLRDPIDIYAELYVLESLRRVYKHVFDPASNVNDSFVATLIGHEVPPPPEDAWNGAAPITLWGMSFTPIRLMHGRLPVLGWRIDRERGSGTRERASGSSSAPLVDPASPAHDPFPLAYCTDVSAVPPFSWPRLEGLRTLVLDALRLRRHPTHLTIDQAVDVATQIDASRTFFVHMAHELGHARTEAELPERLRLAYDGLILGSLGEAGEAAFAADREALARAMARRDRGPHRGSPIEAVDAPAAKSSGFDEQ